MAPETVMTNPSAASSARHRRTRSPCPAAVRKSGPHQGSSPASSVAEAAYIAASSSASAISQSRRPTSTGAWILEAATLPP